jgi:2',3'-cyclic-nucleotide 2'-phosphodiesterase (5'-nucleotidase family)
MKLLVFALIPFMLLINSCSSKKELTYNQRKNGHFQLYSMPDLDIPKSVPANLKRVILISTNDLLGEIDKKNQTVTKDGKTQSIEVGGFKTLEKYYDILKSHYPQEVLIIDSGNSLKSFNRNSYSRFVQISNLFSKLEYTSLTIGAQDLLIGQSDKDQLYALKRVIKTSKVPFIISNIINLGTGERVDWKNTYPYLIRTINNVKVGIISAISPSITQEIPGVILNGHYIQPVETALIKYSRILKSRGAQLIIAKIHANQSCGDALAKKYNLPMDKVNFDPNNVEACNSKDELALILKKLPKDTVHVVVSSSSGGKITNFINGVPIVQSFSLGNYFNVTELFYDIAKNKAAVNKTIIHQPIKLCHEFLKDTQDCFLNDKSVEIESKTKAKFLEKELN